MCLVDLKNIGKIVLLINHCLWLNVPIPLLCLHARYLSFPWSRILVKISTELLFWYTVLFISSISLLYWRSHWRLIYYIEFILFSILLIFIFHQESCSLSCLNIVSILFLSTSGMLCNSVSLDAFYYGISIVFRNCVAFIFLLFVFCAKDCPSEGRKHCIYFTYFNSFFFWKDVCALQESLVFIGFWCCFSLTHWQLWERLDFELSPMIILFAKAITIKR